MLDGVRPHPVLEDMRLADPRRSGGRRQQDHTDRVHPDLLQPLQIRADLVRHTRQALHESDRAGLAILGLGKWSRTDQARHRLRDAGHCQRQTSSPGRCHGAMGLDHHAHLATIRRGCVPRRLAIGSGLEAFPLKKSRYNPTMLKNRMIPTFVVAGFLPLLAWAQAPAPEPAATPSTEAELILDAAIEKVKALKSVTADFEQNGQLLGQDFKITGRYVKDQPDRLFLQLELTGLGNVTGKMLQVSDGQVMWDYKEVLNSPDVRKRSLGPIKEQLQSPDADAEIRDQVLSQLGFGGPDALLVGLRKSIAFNQKSEVEVDGKKMYLIRGRWKDRDTLTGPGQPALPHRATPALRSQPGRRMARPGRRMALQGRALRAVAGTHARESRHAGTGARRTPVGPALNVEAPDPARSA